MTGHETPRTTDPEEFARRLGELVKQTNPSNQDQAMALKRAIDTATQAELVKPGRHMVWVVETKKQKSRFGFATLPLAHAFWIGLGRPEGADILFVVDPHRQDEVAATEAARRERAADTTTRWQGLDID